MRGLVHRAIRSVEKRSIFGSATLCLLSIDKRCLYLHSLNIGDICGLIYIIGREIYSQGYRRSGSKGRLYGALLLDLALLILWAAVLYTCWYWGNGLTKFILSK